MGACSVGEVDDLHLCSRAFSSVSSKLGSVKMLMVMNSLPNILGRPLLSPWEATQVKYMCGKH